MYTCHNCGSGFTGHKRKFCNRTCGQRYNNRKNKGHDVSVYEVEPPAGTYKPTILKCLNCYKDFRRTKNGGSSGNEYTVCCSRQCGSARYSMITTEINSIKAMGAKVISVRVRRDKEREKAAIDAYTAIHEDAMHNHCRHCGGGIDNYIKQMGRRTCDKCKQARRAVYLSLDTTKELIKSKRRSQRKLGLIPLGGDRSRAKHYGAEYEPIKRKIVFDSYGWRCACCGVDTPKDMKGMNQDNSPELDHIIPISRGGPHVYANVQLLCRKCNALKSDRV